nr:sigma 54-interacting transcriptional regulator [Paenibacillus sp. VKM B-2647]
MQVTQEKSFMRLGSNKLKHVDVRIISATNRDLRSMVNKGSFREDLYYRLNIVDMYVPPVRERTEDIPLLVEQFLERHRIKHGKPYHISPQLLRLLMDYHWPGNVREIENAVERAVVLCRDNNLSIEDFPREIRELHRESREAASPGAAMPHDAACNAASLPDQLDEIERTLIEQALEGCQGHVAAAARRLGVSRQSLLYKINKYNMKV